MLCKNQRYPELVIHVDNKEVYGACDACGAKNLYDPTHKMTRYFRNNPPENLKKLEGVQNVNFEKLEKKKKIK